MRTAKIGDTKVTLNERDYKQLLKRFDTSSTTSTAARVSTDGECICKWYTYNIGERTRSCGKCPLHYNDNVAPCITLLNAMIGSDHLLAAPFKCGMSWFAHLDSAARAQLDTIHDFLLRIPKTRR
ncbi:hypothetical protein LCGC14_0316060 [marine sediment metagenome]|uniref:Uncharacterized protein n=1 Tax=marine sediment metagenome TaxID=412755 RepID=A0A0F9TQR3_9ZZZZ